MQNYDLCRILIYKMVGGIFFAYNISFKSDSPHLLAVLAGG